MVSWCCEFFFDAKKMGEFSPMKITIFGVKIRVYIPVVPGQAGGGSFQSIKKT